MSHVHTSNVTDVYPCVRQCSPKYIAHVRLWVKVGVARVRREGTMFFGFVYVALGSVISGAASAMHGQHSGVLF